MFHSVSCVWPREVLILLFGYFESRNWLSGRPGSKKSHGSNANQPGANVLQSDLNGSSVPAAGSGDRHGPCTPSVNIDLKMMMRT